MGVCHSASGNAFETCAGAVVGREWPSCGEGVVRASAVSELTERVKFFFCAITILEHPIISIKLKCVSSSTARPGNRVTDAGTFVLCTLYDFRARGQSLHSPAGAAGGGSQRLAALEARRDLRRLGGGGFFDDHGAATPILVGGRACSGVDEAARRPPRGPRNREKLMKPSHSFTGHCSAENGAPTLTPDVWR